MKRLLAVLLAASMVLGSVNCNVLAASGVETVSESEASETGETADTEESSEESGDTEEDADAAADESAEEAVAASETGTEESAAEDANADAEESVTEDANADAEESVTEEADTDEEESATEDANVDAEESAAEDADAESVDTEETVAESDDEEADAEEETEASADAASEILTDEAEGTAETVETSSVVVYSDSMSYINPLYEDVIGEDDLEQPSGIATVADVDYVTSINEAADDMRQGMEDRDTTIVIGYQVEGDYDSSYASEILEEALEHTGVSTQGDYLRWQYAGWTASISYYSLSDVCYITYTFTMTYYTTADQEAELTTAVEEVESSLGLDSLSDYEKICAIYDYICANVTYDYDNLNDSTYTLKYTAYAALINGTSVCQGYAVLFYRMALDAGVDARVISGIGNGGAHGWNIVSLGNYYYNLDSTWDAVYYAAGYDYNYFLLCDDNFADHTRDDDYSTDEFYAAYPMGTADYDPETANDDADTEESAEVTSAEEFWAAVESGATDISIVSDMTLEGDTYLGPEDYGAIDITVESGVTLTIQDGGLTVGGVLTVDGEIYLSGEGSYVYVEGYTSEINGQGTISGDDNTNLEICDTYLNWEEQSYDTLHTCSIADELTVSVTVYKYLYITPEAFAQISDYTEYDWVGISMLPDQESTVITISQVITMPSVSVPYFGSALYYADENGDAYYNDAALEIVVADGGSLTLEDYAGLGGVQITVQDGGSLTVNDGLYIYHSSSSSRHEGYLCVEDGGTLTVNGYLYLTDDGEEFDGSLLDVAGTLDGYGDIFAYGTNLQQVTGDATGFTGTMDGNLWVNNRLMLAWLSWEDETWTVNDGYDSGIWISPVDQYSIQFYVMSYSDTDGWSMVQVGADDLTATDSAVQVTDTTDSIGTYSEITVSSLGVYKLYYADGGSEGLGVIVTCQLPDIGYYTSSTASEDSLVDSGFVDGTVYYVILSNDVSLTDGSELTVNYLYDYDENEDVTDSWSDYISLEQESDTVWMLTITGTSGNFYLSISAEVEDEYGDSWTTERGINFNNWVSVGTFEELVAALETSSNINVDFAVTLTDDLTISGDRSVNFNCDVTVPEGYTLTINSTGDVYVCLAEEITLTVESGGALVINGYLGVNGGHEEDGVLYNGATINIEEGGTLTVDGDLYLWWSGVEDEDSPSSMIYVSGTLDGSGAIYVYVDGNYVSSVGEVTGTNHFTGTIEDGSNLLMIVDKLVVDYVSWDDDGNAYMEEDYGASMHVRPIYDTHQVNFYRTVYDNGTWSYEQIDFADLS
ncbi:MAG: hypothetical protein LUE16_06700 [Lachnospiraceae bacterium]|nr:hypothetical protein [Lachnospiraceae bacterium]